MAEPAKNDPPATGFADPTRDIRLPPAPGSPPLELRPEWSSYAPRPASAPSSSQLPPPLVDEPTDELAQPTARPAEGTLEFGHGASFATPVLPRVVPAGADRRRRWPWVLLAVLPVVVIVGSGIWLFFLLSAH